MWLIRITGNTREFIDAEPIEGDCIFDDSIQILLNTLYPLYHQVTITAHHGNALLIIYDTVSIRFEPDYILISAVIASDLKEEVIYYSEVDPTELFNKMSKLIEESNKS